MPLDKANNQIPICSDVTIGGKQRRNSSATSDKPDRHQSQRCCHGKIHTTDYRRPIVILGWIGTALMGLATVRMLFPG
jgi:hypothetical protein